MGKSGVEDYERFSYTHSPIVQEQEGLFVPSCPSFVAALLAIAADEDAALRENTSLP
jgi:hypothetical protein